MPYRISIIESSLLDNTFKDKEQIEKVLDFPVLGSIPNSEKVM